MSLLGFHNDRECYIFCKSCGNKKSDPAKKKMFLVRQNRLQLKLFFILNECQLLHAVTGYTYIYIKIGHKQIIQKHMNEMV